MRLYIEKPLDCNPLWGGHSNDRVTVHAGHTEPYYVCGRHAQNLTAEDYAKMNGVL